MSVNILRANTKTIIQIGDEIQKRELKKLADELNNLYEKCNGFDSDSDEKIINIDKSNIKDPKITTQSKGERKYEKHLTSTGSTEPILSVKIDKVDRSRMMGIFYIEYSTGIKERILTISGDSILRKNQKIITLASVKEAGETKVGHPVTFTTSERRYELKNIGKPEGKVVDLSRGLETDVKFSKSCAFQKAMRYIGDKLLNTPKLTVNKIEMREQIWIAPGTRNDSGYAKTTNAPCCDKCKVVLRSVVKVLNKLLIISRISPLDLEM